MSTNDFWSLVEKEKKKKFGFNYGLSLDNTPSGITPTGAFGELVKQYKFESSPYTATKDEDIAPVVLSGGGGMSFGENNTYFQDGPFADGYQFGDITKVILGTAADVSENVAEAVLDATENLIDTTAFGVGVVGGLFDKGFQDDVGEFIAKEPLTYKENGARLNALLNWTAPHGLLTHLVIGDKTEENSVLGEKADGLVQSGAHLAGSYGLQLVGVPAELTMGVNAYGSEIEHAYQNGASHTEAWISGSVAAGAEILFERLSSGVKILKGTTADEAATKALSRNISSRITRSVLKWLGDTAAEGGEEVLTDAVTSVARKLTYEDEKAWEEVFTSEDALDAFVGGAIIGGTVGGYKAVSANRAGVEYASGLTEAQEKAVRKIYDERIAEREASGEKLSALDKNKVWDSVLVDLGFGDANKLTTDEQTVLDKVVEEYIAEQEKEGKKLTAAEKREYKKYAEAQLRKGYVTAEQIERVLGGEDYTNFKTEKDKFLASEDFLAYRNAVQEKENIAELEKQLEELKNAPNTVGNSKAYDALQSKIEDIKSGKIESELFAKAQPEALRVSSLENAMRARVRDRAQGTRLEESYRELERRNTKPNLDPSKYTNEAARATVQNIKDSELGDGTNEFADKVEYLANLSAKTGRVYRLMTEQQLKEAGYWEEGSETHGLVDDDGNVLLNYNSSRNLHWTVGHEVGHVVEKTGNSAAMRKALINYAIAKEGLDKYNARLEEKKKIYKNKKNTTAEIEVANDLLGEYIFTDYEFIKTLAKTERNIFQKIFDEIKSLYKIAAAGSYQQRELEKAKRLFQKALDEVAKGQKNTTENGGVKYAIQSNIVDTNGNVYKKVVKVGVTIYNSIKHNNTDFTNYLKDHIFPRTFSVPVLDGTIIKVEFAKDSDQIQKDGDKSPRKVLGELRSADTTLKKIAILNIRDLIKNSEPLPHKSQNSHQWLDTNGWSDRKAYMRYADGKNGDKIYPVIIHIANARDGRHILYDVSVFEKEGSTVDMGASALASLSDDGTSSSRENETKLAVKSIEPSGEMVAQDASVVKSPNSVSKDTGKTLYTGSPVVDIEKFKVGGVDGSNQTGDRYGKGIYLTTNESTAKGYAGDKGRVYRISADELNIFDLNNSITEDMKATLARLLNGEDKQFRNSILRSFRSERVFTDFDSAEQFFDEQGEVWKAEDGYYSANKPEIKSADSKTGRAVIEYTDFSNIDNAIGSLTGNQLYDALKSISTDDFASFITGHGFDGIAFDEDSNNQQYVIYRNEDKLNILEDEGAPSARFSLSKPVEENKDLVALHNLTQDKLLKSLELGGLPMPSIAITKADIPHDNFGEITLILGKDSIDPKANKKNVVYSADAWTPTFPQVEYEADANVERKINKKLLDLATKVDDVFKHDIDMLRYSHEDNLNRYGGEEGYIQYVMDKYGFKAAYLEDQGKHVDKITKQEEVPKAYNSANEAKYQAIADILGVSNADEIGKLNLKETIEQYGDQLEDIYPGMTKSAMRMSGIFRQVMAYMEDTSGAPVYRTVTDESAMRKAVDDAIDMEGFEAWTRKLFYGIVKDTGIYNNKDLFTPSGNRKSFKQTHLPFTLENIVKAMASQNQGNTKNVSGFNGIKSLRAGTAERFKSIEAMHERKGRLQHLTQEEADKINDDLSTRLFSIIETIDNESGNHGETNSFIRFDTIGEILMEVSEGGKYNVADIQKVFDQYGRNINDDLAADIRQLLFDVSQMPVNIYEAKPERAVSFDEVGVFVIPRNADVKLKQELLNRGYSIAEYDPDVEGDRQKVVNQFEEYKFSLSAASEDTPSERGAFNERWSDFGRTDPLAEFAPVVDTEVAPVAEENTATQVTADKTEAVGEMFPDDNTSIEQELDSLLQQKEQLEGRMTEALNAEDYDAFAVVNDEYNSLMARIEELEAAENERFDALDDADAPPVRENGWLERADVVPLTKKAATDIARDVRQQLGLSNKQMYDVHMLIEEYSQSEFPDREQLFNEIKEKFGTYTESEFDETVKEAKSYLRTYGLFVSDSIKNEIADYRQLMRKNCGKIRFSKEGTDVDVLYHELNSQYPHLFPDDIFSPTDQFLQMVDVANMDAETKFEQELPDEVIWDVVDAVTNGVGEYRQTQREKASNKHSREAFNSLMKDADSYVPPVDDDIAPLPTTEPSVDEIAPTAENVSPRENIAPSKADEPKTANERLAKKIANYENELANNQRLREESKIDYDNEIARLQAEYDAKKNKRSLSAHDLLRRIEQVKRMKNNVDADYAKRINDLGNRIEKLSTKDAKTAAQRQTKMEQHTEMWKELIGDTSTWKDMALGLSYKIKTLRRILRKVVRGVDGKPDIALADRIYDELETKYDHNEALLKRESRKVKAVFEKLNLNHAEDTYAHMLGELRHNPETTLTKDVVDEYYRKHKSKIDTKKVDTAITEARRTFDELIARVNTALREQGFKEIPYRKGYFPHFTNPKQGWLAKLLNWKTIDTEVPTSIAGLTETFTPQRSWQSFNKERKGDTTDYSLYQGLDTYIHGALDWIYHIDDLQSRRALENHIRYVHSEEGVKARIDEIKANEEYDADEAQALIDGVLAEANNPLSGLVRELMRRTNTLANKKAAGDRKIEDDTNRKIYSVMTNLNNRINANMVVGSFSSALTNFIPMVQSWHQVSPYFTVRGLGDYVRSVVRDDGMIEKSDFLTNRLMEEENLYQTGWDKVTDKAAWMMNVIDSITSNTVWRSKYLQNIKEGMSESQAIKDADQFAKNLMAGRSRGNMPTVFDEKNPFTKIFTAFQLEVANQYGYMFDDVVKDSKSPLRLVKGYATAFLGAYLYNALYSSLVGRDAAFDPIGIIEDLLRDLGVGDDDEEDDEDKVKDALFGFGENIVQEVPFIGGLVGGGRIPMSSALPYSNDSTPFQSIVNDVSEGNWSSFGKEFLKPLYYLAMPVGGGQLKKTVEGLSMFDDDLPVSGSYTGSGKLRFPVEKNLGNVVQAGLFGQYAGENARYYFDNDIAPLGEKQIQEYIDVDIPIRDYWDYRKGLKGKDTLGEKLAYIDKLDLPIRKQNILANNLTDRKEPIDMADWDKYDGLEEYNYAKKYPEKYQFLEANGISVEEYNNFDDDTKEAYSWAYQNPEKYTLSKAVAKDLMTYRKYASDLSDIKADKDEDGKSISGSRKDKVIEYINNMYADYGEKIILFKSEYPSDDTYNNDIVEYLNSREDISYEETVTILRELGFTVLDDGTVLWD